jgi:mono/diheme cytochrome c family protein
MLALQPNNGINIYRVLLVSMATVLALSGAVAFAEIRKDAAKASSKTAASSAAAAVSFNRDIQPIFISTCVLCHQGAPGAGALNLEPGQSYLNLVGRKSSESPLLRVSPGVPATSYIIHKLLGTQVTAGGSGARMPLVGEGLSKAQAGLIQQWISEGAPNN